MRLHITAIVALALLCGYLPAESYNLKTVTTRDGLTNSAVLSFGQINNGLMLIGTCDGVNCFDGSRIFPLPAQNKHSIKGNVIQNIVVDHDGRGWILTNHGLGVILRFHVPLNLPRFQSARGIRLNAEDQAIVLQDSALYCHTGRDTVFMRLPLQGDQAERVLDFVMTRDYLYLFMPDGIVRYGIQRNGDALTLGMRKQISSEPLLVANYDTDGREMFVDGDGVLWSFDLATGNRRQLVSLQADIHNRGMIGSVRSLNRRIFVCFVASGVLVLEPEGDSYAKHDLGLQVGALSSFRSPTDLFREIILFLLYHLFHVLSLFYLLDLFLINVLQNLLS